MQRNDLIMNRLREKYITTVMPALTKEFGYANTAQIPKIRKVVLNSGVGKIAGDEKAVDAIEKAMTTIAGQKAVRSSVKKAIAAFKTREGMKVGVRVTLRGEKMYDFLDRLISIALPRTRDFHGVNTSGIDQAGNLTIGIKEDIVFPEVSHERTGGIFGFQVTVVTNTNDKKSAETLFRLLGFPLKKA